MRLNVSSRVVVMSFFPFLLTFHTENFRLLVFDKVVISSFKKQ